MSGFDTINFTDIIPADYNPRILSDEEYGKLQKSIDTYGVVDPIIINLRNNRIIGGHQRYRVMRDEHLKDPTKFNNLVLLKRGDIGWVFTDNDLTIESEEHEKALNIALNKISGEWDYPKLTSLIDDLTLTGFDITLTGFDTLDLDELDAELDNIDLGDTNVEELNTNEASYRLIVAFNTEEAQSELFNRLMEEGYDVKLISEN